MVAQAFHPALTDLDTTAQAVLGTIYELDNKRYKYVKFSGTTIFAAGDVACYVVTDTSLQTCDALNTVLGAGVVQVAVPTGTVVYGWIQISGMATVSTTVGNSAAQGDRVAVTGTGSANSAFTKAGTSGAVPSYGTLVDATNKIVQLDFPN